MLIVWALAQAYLVVLLVTTHDKMTVALDVAQHHIQRFQALVERIP